MVMSGCHSNYCWCWKTKLCCLLSLKFITSNRITYHIKSNYLNWGDFDGVLKAMVTIGIKTSIVAMAIFIMTHYWLYLYKFKNSAYSSLLINMVHLVTMVTAVSMTWLPWQLIVPLAISGHIRLRTEVYFCHQNDINVEIIIQKWWSRYQIEACEVFCLFMQ
jgi:hypothetical protein